LERVIGVLVGTHDRSALGLFGLVTIITIQLIDPIPVRTRVYFVLLAQGSDRGLN
jgi:hypothetical protein